MNKKLTALALAATMLISSTALLGCSKGNGGKDGELPTVTWHLPVTKAEIDEAQQKKVEDYVNEHYFGEKVGANLKLVLIDQASFDQQLNLILSSGEDCDLVYTSSWLNKYEDNVSKGSFMDIKDLLDKYGSAIKEKVDERAWSSVTEDGGEIMAIPNHNTYAQTHSYVFKKELVDKYNIDYKNINTIDELEPFLKLIKENEPDMYPMYSGPSKTLPHGPATRSDICTWVYWDEVENRVETRLEDESAVESLRKIHDFYNKGYIAKDAATKGEYTAEVKSGKYAVVANPGIYTEDGSKSTNAYGYECVESLVSTNFIKTDSYMGGATAIAYNSKHPEEAIKILNLIWEKPEISNRIAYGIEGEDWNIVDDSDPEMPIVTVRSGEEKKWGIYHNYLGPLFDQWGSEWNSREAIEAIEAGNKTAKQSGLFGFVFDKEPVKNELVQISAIASEVNQVFNIGSMTDFDAYIAEVNKRMDAAGLQKVKAEVERQIKEWQKTK